MPLTLAYQPPVASNQPSAPFLQQICIRDGSSEIGSARWTVAGPGIIQILDLQIDPKRHRVGYGRQLLNEVLAQALAYHKIHKLKFRRAWMRLAQKDQVKARAFLTGAGFHHVGTLNGLHKDQDDLIYVKSLD